MLMLLYYLLLYFSVCFKLDDKARDREESVTLDEFESICSEEFDRLSQMIINVRSKQDVSSVMFAGGSSRLQWFKRAVEKMGNFYDLKFNTDSNMLFKNNSNSIVLIDRSRFTIKITITGHELAPCPCDT